jgi:lambda family phage portal protein
MNFIDKAIAFVNPESGLRRADARAALNFRKADQKRFAAGSHSRHRDDRQVTSAGGNELLYRYMVRARNRARQQDRDNGLAKRISSLWTHHLIGDGFTTTFFPTSEGGKVAAKRQNELFNEWFHSTLLDSTGVSDGDGFFTRASRFMVRDGEALIRKIVVSQNHPDFKKMKVPLKLQLLEADFLDETKSETWTNGNPIVMGIEFDKDFPDVRVAYWLFDNHPGERSLWNRAGFQSKRVPADEIIHLYEPDRGSRGVTWFHAVLDTMQDLAEYFAALRMKAKIEACFSVIINSANPSTTAAPDPTGSAAQTDVIEDGEELSPGIIRYGRPGDTVTALNPSNSSGHSVLTQTLIRFIAIGCGLTYDQAYSDLTGANYSSLRAGKIEFNRGVRQKQSQILDPAAMKVAAWFAEIGYLAGHWRSATHKAEISFDPPDTVDPLKDGQAEKQDIEMGMDTMSEKLTARGKDPAEHWARLKEEVDLLKTTFGDEAKHPFLQTLTAQAAKAATATATDEEADPPPTKPGDRRKATA